MRMNDCEGPKVHYKKVAADPATRNRICRVSTGNPAFSRARPQCIKAVDPEMPR